MPSHFMMEPHYVNQIKHAWQNRRLNDLVAQTEYVSDFMITSTAVTNVPDVVDYALTKTRQLFRLFELGDRTVMLAAAVQRIGSLLQGFDVVDVEDSAFAKQVETLSQRYHLGMKYAVLRDGIDDVTAKDIVQLHARSALARSLMGLSRTGVSDLYNVYVTPELRVVSLSDALRSHACDSVFLLNVLCDMTRVHVYIHASQAKYSNHQIFLRALRVIENGVYPSVVTDRPEYVSAKKRMMALRTAQMYVQLQFTAYIKYARIMEPEDEMVLFWHSVFQTMPILLKRALLSIVNKNVGLSHLPIHLLVHAFKETHRPTTDEVGDSILLAEAHQVFVDGTSTMYLKSPQKAIVRYMDMIRDVLHITYERNFSTFCSALAVITQYDTNKAYLQYFGRACTPEDLRDFGNYLNANYLSDAVETPVAATVMQDEMVTTPVMPPPAAAAPEPLEMGGEGEISSTVPHI